jgi:putative molybdopterin biosynthesis protein
MTAKRHGTDDVGASVVAPSWPYMSTREVAEYLRMRERTIYDLVQSKRIPCVKVAGKWLFPTAEIDRWVKGRRESDSASGRNPVPNVLAGSRDPLLDWCVAQSGCGLALCGGGSLSGLRQVARGEAVACGIHMLDPAAGTYNETAIHEELTGLDVVALEWARREQGLVMAAGNPWGLSGVEDLAKPDIRVVGRPEGSGGQILLMHLLSVRGLDWQALSQTETPAQTGFEVGLAVLEGAADIGLATRVVARRLRLHFVPLTWERFDLVVRRWHFFEPPVQALLTFAQGTTAQAKAADLQGYDLSGLGKVRYNAPQS